MIRRRVSVSSVRNSGMISGITLNKLRLVQGNCPG